MRSGAARKPDLNLIRSDKTLARQPAPGGPAAPILLFPEPESAAPQPAALLREERLRWLSSLAIVLIIYGGILAWLVHSAGTRDIMAPPEGAMVVELAMEVGTPPSQPDAATSQEPVEPTPVPPPEPEPRPEPEPEPEIQPVPEVPEPEVVTPTEPEPEPQVEPEPEREVQPLEDPDVQETPVDPAPASTSSSSTDTLPTADAGAPTVGASDINAANQASSWRDLLLHRLEQAKRYPYQARRMRQEGVSHLRFTMDREGQVLSASIDQSSGHKLLDSEVLALIRRIQPLPKPPSDIPGDPIEVVVPVEFFLRG